MKNNNDLKPLNQEEFDTLVDDHMNYSSKDLLEAARQGFVPRSEALLLSSEIQNWPSGSQGISIRFCDYSEEYFEDLIAGWNLKYIPRPEVLKWTPNTGDPVFFRHPLDEYTIHVGIYQRKGGRGYSIVHNLNNQPLFVTEGEIKPFRTEHIGKRWKEIPSS